MTLADSGSRITSAPLIPEPEPAESKTRATMKGDLDLETIKQLREQFLTIQRIEQGSDALWIDFSAIAHTTDDAFLEQLRPLARHVVWLNLSRSGITDQSMPVVASMENLEELDLRNCEISDVGLAQLGGLEQLKKLNLTGTSVSDDSFDTLANLPSLEVVDLFMSEWSMDGLARLREANPNLTVNFGE